MQRPTIYSISREAIIHIGRLLFDGEDAVPARKALVAFATTCRYLSEPLLDVIWHELPDIIPLLLQLPADLYTTALEETAIGPQYKRRKEFILLRDPVPDDFQRIAKYSHRVKGLGDEYWRVTEFRHSDYKVPLRMWDMLAEHGPVPLLPNLIRLYCTAARPCTVARSWYGLWDSDDDQLHNLDFSLGISSAPDCASDVIRGIARFAPRIKALQWFTSRDQLWDLRGPDTRMLSSICKFEAPTLRVAPDALWALGTLAHLSDLAVCIDFTSPEWGDWDVLPHGRAARLFPALEQLKLTGVGLMGVVAFMDTITSPSLTYLKLWGQGNQLSDMLLAAFCSVIGTSSFHESVHTFELDWERRSAWYCPRMTTSLSPLLSLRRLQTLRFKGNFPMLFIDDAFVDAMSRSWPEIRILRFRDTTPPEPEPSELWDIFEREAWTPQFGDPSCPKTTLAGLLPLARRCAHLEVLELPVDMRIRPQMVKPPAGEISPPVRPPRSHMHTLLAGPGWVMGDIWEVASWDDRNGKAWRNVRTIYERLIRVQRAEWSWLKQAKRRLREGTLA
ncbi:hypothetical protein GY45DRAFT_1433647 [Cubamyces sp. BRFM 1775]|nr:hypothetical protein GY45DRAFT_1433647 [Cubamyces sp. BRFM 1775]